MIHKFALGLLLVSCAKTGVANPQPLNLIGPSSKADAQGQGNDEFLFVATIRSIEDWLSDLYVVDSKLETQRLLVAEGDDLAVFAGEKQVMVLNRSSDAQHFRIIRAEKGAWSVGNQNAYESEREYDPVDALELDEETWLFVNWTARHLSVVRNGKVIRIIRTPIDVKATPSGIHRDTAGRILILYQGIDEDFRVTGEDVVFALDEALNWADANPETAVVDGIDLKGTAGQWVENSSMILSMCSVMVTQDQCVPQLEEISFPRVTRRWDVDANLKMNGSAVFEEGKIFAQVLDAKDASQHLMVGEFVEAKMTWTSVHRYGTGGFFALTRFLDQVWLGQSNELQKLSLKDQRIPFGAIPHRSTSLHITGP